MKLFTGRRIDEVTNEVLVAINQEIRKAPETTFGHVNSITQFASQLKSNNEIKAIDLKMAHRTSKVKMEAINARQLPADMMFNGDGDPVVAVVSYTIPYSGDQRLLEVFPNGVPDPNLFADVNPGILVFRAPTYYGTVDLNDHWEQVKISAKRISDSLVNSINAVNKEVSEFNARIPAIIEDAINHRKELIEKSRKLSADLNDF